MKKESIPFTSVSHCVRIYGYFCFNFARGNVEDRIFYRDNLSNMLIYFPIFTWKLQLTFGAPACNTRNYVTKCNIYRKCFDIPTYRVEHNRTNSYGFYQCMCSGINKSLPSNLSLLSRYAPHGVQQKAIVEYPTNEI